MGNLSPSGSTNSPAFKRATEILKELSIIQYFPDPTEVNYKVLFNYYDRNDGNLERGEVKKIFREFLTMIKIYIEEDEDLYNRLLKEGKIETTGGKSIKSEMIGMLKKKKLLNEFIILGGFGSLQSGGAIQFEKGLDNEKSEIIDLLFGKEDVMDFDVFVDIFESIVGFPDGKKSQKVTFFKKI